MNIQELLMVKAEQQFEKMSDDLNLEFDVHSTAERYVHDSYAVEDSVSTLLAIELQDDVPGRIIKFNLLAAAGLVASLVGGIAGATNPLILGSVIVSSITSLTGLFEKTTPSEGALFWIIYEMENHEGNLEDIQSQFITISNQLIEIEPDDFRPALRKLLDIGAIEQQGNLLKVIEKLVILWFKGN